jgi:hypothetical protein
MTQHPLDENDVGNGNIVASIDKFWHMLLMPDVA